MWAWRVGAVSRRHRRAGSLSNCNGRALLLACSWHPLRESSDVLMIAAFPGDEGGFSMMLSSRGLKVGVDVVKRVRQQGRHVVVTACAATWAAAPVVEEGHGRWTATNLSPDSPPIKPVSIKSCVTCRAHIPVISSSSSPDCQPDCRHCSAGHLLQDLIVGRSCHCSPCPVVCARWRRA